MTRGRSRLRRLVVGAALVLVLLMQLFGIALSSVSARNAAVRVAEDSISREGDTVVESILRHLEPAQQSAEVTARLVADGLLSRRPVSWSARAARDASGKLLAIVGVDVELSGLSEFIDVLAVSEHGEAFVLSGADVVAAPSSYDQGSFVDDDGSLRLLTATELGVPALVIDGPRDDVTVVDGDSERELVLSTPLPEGQPKWRIVLRAPESDFTRPITLQRRSLLWFWLGGLTLVGISALVMQRVTRPVAMLQEQASTDPLTGLGNRRALDEAGRRWSPRPPNAAGSWPRWWWTSTVSSSSTTSSVTPPATLRCAW